MEVTEGRGGGLVVVVAVAPPHPPRARQAVVGEDVLHVSVVLATWTVHVSAVLIMWTVHVSGVFTTCTVHVFTALVTWSIHVYVVHAPCLKHVPGAGRVSAPPPSHVPAPPPAARHGGAGEGPGADRLEPVAEQALRVPQQQVQLQPLQWNNLYNVFRHFHF